MESILERKQPFASLTESMVALLLSPVASTLSSIDFAAVAGGNEQFLSGVSSFVDDLFWTGL